MLLLTLAALGASIAWLQLRAPEYEASAQLLVAPVPPDDETFVGLPVLRDAGEPTAAIQTAAALLNSREAARVAARRIGSGWSLGRVLDAVEVEPARASNVVAVTATADEAALSAEMANVFAEAALEARNREFRRHVEAELAQLAAARRVQGDLTGELPANLAGRISRLKGLRGTGDPTVSIGERAPVPASASETSPPIVIGLALVAGLVLGTGAALLLELTDRRIRDEAELLALTPVPVLARIPELQGRIRPGQTPSDAPWSMPPVVTEAFRAIRAQLSQDEPPSRVIMVTSPTRGDGKTTSAVNLAVSVAAAGHSVILMDCDTRKPDIARLLRIELEPAPAQLHGLGISNGGFEGSLVQVPDLPSLSVLSTPRGSTNVGLRDELSRGLAELVRVARHRVEYVVLDTPPLGEVGDALRLASAVDQVILVVRARNTDRRKLEFTQELLERAGRTPAGCLLLGS